MIQKYLDHLDSIPLFRTFTKSGLLSYLNLYYYTIEEFAPQEVIFNEGELCQSIFIVLDGTVQIQKVDSSGRYFHVGQAKTGDMMGANVLFSQNSRYPLSTLALEKVVLLSLPKDLVLKLCQVNLNFLETLLQVSSSKAFLLAQRLDQVTVQTLRQNICRFLLGAMEEQQTSIIKLPFTKTAWAESLGVQRPSLQRELKRLEDLKVLLSHRDTIHVLDEDQLKLFAFD